MDIYIYIYVAEEVETAVDIAEEVVEMVEKVAEDVEKAAEDIGDHLREGTQLGKADLFVERVAKEIVKDANLAEQVIHKVFLSLFYLIH